MNSQLTTAAIGLLAIGLLVLGRLERFQLLRRLTLWLALTATAAVVHFIVLLVIVPDPAVGVTWSWKIVLAALWFLAARIMLVLVLEWLLEQRFNAEVPRLAREVVALAVYLVVAAVLLQVLFLIQVGTLLATSAVITVVIGLALQQTLGNLFAGIGLAWERRLDAGTWLLLDGELGRVEELGWRSLTVRTRLGERIIVPNSTAAQTQLRLLGRGGGPVAVPIRLGVSYRIPPDQAKAVLHDVATGMAEVLPRPVPRILVIEYADSAIVYECRLWTQRPQLRNEIIDTFLTNAWSALARAGMEIPFPQRTLHFAQAATDTDSRLLRAAAFERSLLFAGLPAAATEALAERSRLLRFAPGEPVVREGDASRALYVIADGAAKVERGSKVIGDLARGELFGEMAFLTGEPRAATVRADGALAVVEVDSTALGTVLTDHPNLVDELAARMARRQAELEAAGRTETGIQPRRGLVGMLRASLLRLVGVTRSPDDES